MINRKISIRDRHSSKPLCINPIEILPSLCSKDFLPQQHDFPVQEEGSTTDPFDHFESDCCTSFPQFEHQYDIIYSKIHGSVLISEHSPSPTIDSAEEVYLNFQSTETLQSLVQSSSGRDLEYKLMNESAADNAINGNRSCTTISFDKNDKVENQEVVYSHGHTSLAASNVFTSETGAVTNKKRIRWTQELHNQFIECVNRLGGAKKATPMGILKLMSCEGLTIFHIKSHLQKYRVAQYVPSSKELELEEIPDTGAMSELDPKMGMQMAEALRMQIDVQQRLCEQLECQRKLQLQIEEQAKQLKKMLDHQVEKTPMCCDAWCQLNSNK